jgi:metal transporter CNNM
MLLRNSLASTYKIESYELLVSNSLLRREIIDESDVYIDVHKAIRRMAPAPKARVPKGQIVADPDAPAVPEDRLIELDDENGPDGNQRDRLGSVGSMGQGPIMAGTSPKTTFMMMRRSSGGQDSSKNAPIAIRGNANEMREHLKHLGPSNLASRPKSTRYNTVKIKPGNVPGRQSSMADELYRDNHAPEGSESESLWKSDRKDASDGVQAVQKGYGATEDSSSRSLGAHKESLQANFDGISGKWGSLSQVLYTKQHDSDDSDMMGSLPSRNSSPIPRKRNPARSGSITENIVDAGGFRKVVLETNSSSDDLDTEAKHDSVSYSKNNSQLSLNGDSGGNAGHNDAAQEEPSKKKQNKRRRKRKGAAKGEDTANPNGSG